MFAPKVIFSFVLFMLGGFVCDIMQAKGVTDPFIFMMFGAVIMFIIERVKFVDGK